MVMVDCVDDAGVYAKYADELMRFATVLVGPFGAEDLVATVFARALMSPSWPRIGNRRAYLYRAMTNEARSQYRATQRRLAREIKAGARDVVEPVMADPDVLAALRRLSVRQRAVIWMAYWRDAAVEEIARTLGVSTRTVERDLHQARQQLERDLG